MACFLPNLVIFHKFSIVTPKKANEYRLLLSIIFNSALNEVIFATVNVPNKIPVFFANRTQSVEVVWLLPRSVFVHREILWFKGQWLSSTPKSGYHIIPLWMMSCLQSTSPKPKSSVIGSIQDSLMSEPTVGFFSLSGTVASAQLKTIWKGLVSFS